jgi:hypothetical protein
VGLALLIGACGGGTSDGPEQGSETDPVRDALEANLESALLRDLPLLEGEEASCISDAILAELPDFGTALEDPESFAEEILATTEAAQERCLTPDRVAELEAIEGEALTREPEEEAFLLVARGVAGGLDSEDQELVDAGYLVCGLAEEAGSLETLLERLVVAPAASARAAANLSPLLGKVLQVEELITLSTIAVVALCPEVDDG